MSRQVCGNSLCPIGDDGQCACVDEPETSTEVKWLDRLVGVKAPRGSGALGRHQRRSIVSGIFLKLNVQGQGDGQA